MPAPARVMIAGAGGQLGLALRRLLGPRVVMAAGRAALDVTDAGAVRRAVRECEPELVVNASAYNEVDGAERSPEQAFAVNAAGAGPPGRAACEAAGAVLVHVSTDYVFDGQPAAAVHRGGRAAPARRRTALRKLAGERRC